MSTPTTGQRSGASDGALLLLRKALAPFRGIPGFRRLVNPLRRRFANVPRALTVEDFDGDLSACLSLNERMQSQIFWYGYCSRDICIVVKRLLRRGMVAIDAGANIGEITLVAAKRVGPEGRVYAFEPMSEIADHLAQNVQLNSLSHVTIVRCGLAATHSKQMLFAAKEKFHDGSVHQGLGTLYSSAQRSVATEEVELTTLDLFCAEQGLGRLDLVKVDVEGAELAALLGGVATLERFKPYLIIEVQEETARAAGYEAADILRLLKPLGYRFDIIGRKGLLTPVDESTLRRFQNVLCTPSARDRTDAKP